MTPRLVIIGQITVDDVVPAEPGPWRRQLGGNALYSAAGARLVLPESEIGIVSRLGSGIDDGIERALQEKGFNTALARRSEPHLVEWLLYDAGGGRRAIPKGERFHAGQDNETQRQIYLAALEAISPAPEDVPASWSSATTFHLAPQVWKRHAAHLNAIPPEALITVDPSPHYAKDWDLDMFTSMVRDGLTFLPSEQELCGLIRCNASPADGPSLAKCLVQRLGRHAVVKLGAAGALYWDGGGHHAAPARGRAVDPTGAGDGFCGAFAAARTLGKSHADCVKAAIVAGAMMVECRGAVEALDLSRSEFTRRLGRYREQSTVVGKGLIHGSAGHA